MKTCSTCKFIGWITEVNYGAQYVQKRMCTNDCSPAYGVTMFDDNRAACPFHREVVK